jgi:hypothetical protein
VPPRLGVEGGDADEAVHALLRGEQPVGVLAARDECRRLDAGLLPGRHLHQLHLHAAPLGPAHLHPQEHLGPVLGIGPACAGVHGDDRVAAVVLAAEQARLLQFREAGLDGCALLGQLSGHLLVLGRQLLERLQILDVAVERPVRLEPASHGRVLGAHARRALLVVPEAGGLHLALQLGGARL